jgi:hypothetical protein
MASVFSPRSGDPAPPGAPAGPPKPGGLPAPCPATPPRRFGWGRVAAVASPLTPRHSVRDDERESGGVASLATLRADPPAHAPPPATDYADLPHHVLLQVMQCLAVGDTASWDERAVRRGGLGRAGVRGSRAARGRVGLFALAMAPWESWEATQRGSAAREGRAPRPPPTCRPRRAAMRRGAGAPPLAAPLPPPPAPMRAP